VKAFRNIFVKDYTKFPYQKLTGNDVLRYTGKINYYTGSTPDRFDSKQDILFDCDCEFGQWKRLEKVFS